MKAAQKFTIICVAAVLLGGATTDYVYEGWVSRLIIYNFGGYSLRWITYQFGGCAVSSDKLVPRAVNEGEPVVSLYPRSRVAKDLRGVARLVVDEESTPEVAEGEGQRKWFG